MTFFTKFSKTAAPQQVIFQEKLSATIIFKLFKFNVNLWTLCKKYLDPLNINVQVRLMALGGGTNTGRLQTKIHMSCLKDS